MLADVSGDEVEEYLLKNALVETAENEASVPTNSPCTDEEKFLDDVVAWRIELEYIGEQVLRPVDPIILFVLR